jgi:hypothetical protein
MPLRWPHLNLQERLAGMGRAFFRIFSSLSDRQVIRAGRLLAIAAFTSSSRASRS